MKNICLHSFAILLGAVFTCNAQFTNGGWIAATNSTAITEVSDDSQFGDPQQVDLGGTTAIAEAVTPEIQALARGLENDPKRIFDFVHDHIRHVLYFGSKKGAQLTLLERSGNDFDQCALLTALLTAAGYSPTYEFALVKMPYSNSTNHQDLVHWLELNLPGGATWATKTNYFAALLGARGYPANAVFAFSSDHNLFGFQRIWVKVTIDGKTYYLDPAFKVSEPVAGIDLHTATKFNLNQFTNAAASGATVNNVWLQNINEADVRDKLRSYTTNLLGYIQTNCPNASVEEVLGGSRIVSSIGTDLSQSRPFSLYTPNGFPLITWTYQPTNLMTRYSIGIGIPYTNYYMLVPALQGARVTLSFNSNGVMSIWQDDSNVLQVATSGGSTMAVYSFMDHPHGTWDTANNALIDTGVNDEGDGGRNYQRTNSTYAMLYAFDMDTARLWDRQQKLDAYREQGLADDSLPVVSEILNIMGLTYYHQTQLAGHILAVLSGQLQQYHHRSGRVGYESGNGYYLDTSLENFGWISSSGNANADITANNNAVSLFAYYASAFEHGMVEEMESSNLLAASTVRMLQLGNTNGLKTWRLDSTSWNPDYLQLTNYNSITNDLANYVYNNYYTIFLPADGGQELNGPGGWRGYGMVISAYPTVFMAVGAFNGGVAAWPGAVPSAAGVFVFGRFQSSYLGGSPVFVGSLTGGDPVDMSDGSQRIVTTDLSLGNVEPRGINFVRYYKTSHRRQNLAGLGAGWLHNYYMNLAEVTAPEAVLGRTTPAQAAAMLAASQVGVEIHGANGNAFDWMLTVLTAKWMMDQVVNTGVSIHLGKDILQFVRQPDGSFAPPAGCTMTLSKTNSAYTLQERHGRAFHFDSIGRLTNIVDQYNQPLNVSYLSSTDSLPQTVTDWKGLSLTFSYSGSPARLTQVADGTGRTVTYGYTTNADSQLDLASAVGAESQTNRFLYDANHQMVAEFNALNQLVVSNINDNFGRVVTQYTQGDTNKMWQFLWSGWMSVEQDPAGSRRRFFFDDKTRPVGLQDALSNLSLAFYDGQDHVTNTVTPMLETNRITFDGHHNATNLIDALGYTNKFVFDSQDNLIRWIDPRGNSNRFGYNAQFSLTGVTNGAGDWVTFGYNSSDGSITNIAEPGGANSFTYDANGYLSGIIYPGGLGSQGFLNNALGDVLTYTNGNGFLTTFQYNQRRQMTNAIGPSNVIARATFDPVGNLQLGTDPRGYSVSNFWSPTRKLLSTTLPSTPQGAPVLTSVYDNRDWLSRSLDPLQHGMFLTNDVAGRPIALTDPLLRVWKYGYDSDGRLVGSTNATLEAASQTWNARSDLLSVTDGATNRIFAAYDFAGNQTFLTNRNAKKWQFQFDAANRLTNTISPRTNQTWQVWNNRGLLAAMREPSGQWTSNFFDVSGRVTNITDQAGVRILRYDGDGNLTNIVEGGKSNSWIVDAYGQVSGYRDSDGNLIQYRYDANGNLTNLVYPGNRTVTYSYDSLNRLTNVTDWANQQTKFTWDLASRVTSITRPNNTVRSIGYDDAGEITNIIERTASGYPIAYFKLNYNNAARAQWEFTAPLPHPYTLPTNVMTFDDDNRLTTLNGSSITNDLDGNMTWGPLTNGTNFATFSYDHRNWLQSAGGVSYGYDPLGVRTSLTNGTNIVRFVVNPNASLSQVLMRIKGGTTNYYIYGLGLLYEITETATTTNTLTYHFDLRGSTIAVTDSGGNIKEQFEYSTYGTITYRSNLTDTPFLFDGRFGVQTDPNGLLYMRARYYNPFICRFINADPARWSGGLNFYAYADGNPVSLIDPFGLGSSEPGSTGSWSDRAYDKFEDGFVAGGNVVFPAIGKGFVYGFKAIDKVAHILTDPPRGSEDPRVILYLLPGLGQARLLRTATTLERVAAADTATAAAPGARVVIGGVQATEIAGRLTPAQMAALQAQHGNEFAQVYLTGAGPNGGGGTYYLIQGNAGTVSIPLGSNVRWISHTHPEMLDGLSVPVQASSADLNVLMQLQQAGSPQRVSLIVPEVGQPFRFGPNTPP